MKSNELMQDQMTKGMELNWAKQEEKHRVLKKLLDIHDAMYQDGLLTAEESHKVLEIIDGVLYE